MTVAKPPARHNRGAKRGLPKRTVATLLATLLAVVVVGLAVQQWVSTHSNAKPTPSTGHPLSEIKLFVDPNSPAARQAKAWRTSRPDQASKLDQLAALPTARWLTAAESLDDLGAYLKTAEKAQAVPVLVVYNLPLRDCGRYSTGGARAASDYRAFIQRLAGLVGDQQVIAVLEPDALAGVEGLGKNGAACLTPKQQTMYYDLLRESVTRLKALPRATVYLDAGNSAWVPEPQDMATRLQRAGVAEADGFSLNISNFQALDATLTYGQAIADLVGDKHFVVDTSRNGAGPYTNSAFPDFNWCNPPGRALGHFPTTNTGQNRVNAYLYIKYPGESDGEDPNAKKCFNGPVAGTWWPEYALGLIDRWPDDLQPR